MKYQRTPKLISTCKHCERAFERIEYWRECCFNAQSSQMLAHCREMLRRAENAYNNMLTRIEQGLKPLPSGIERASSFLAKERMKCLSK